MLCCAHAGRNHGPHASYHRLVDTLVGLGLRSLQPYTWDLLGCCSAAAFELCVERAVRPRRRVGGGGGGSRQKGGKRVQVSGGAKVEQQEGG